MVSSESSAPGLLSATSSLCPYRTFPWSVHIDTEGERETAGEERKKEGKQERGLSCISFHKDINPIGSGLHPCASLKLNYFFTGPSLNTATLGIRTSTYKFEGNTTFSL